VTVFISLCSNCYCFALQVSNDDRKFTVPKSAARLAALVNDIFANEEEDDDEPDENAEIPLPNVDSKVLEKIIEFCIHYVKVEAMTPIQTPLKSNSLGDIVQEYYANFVTDIDRNLLFDLVAAANFMDIKPLLDLTCLAVSILIKGKSATELRQMFNLSSEYTAEERELMERENEWADQPAAAAPTNTAPGRGGNPDNVVN
jgi:S-phase kinase-associated protein 1